MNDGMQWIANAGRLLVLQGKIMQALDAWVQARGVPQEERLLAMYEAYMAELERQRDSVVDT